MLLYFLVLCRTFLPFLFLPAPLVLFWGWYRVSWRWVLVGWLWCGLFSWLYGRRFIPLQPPSLAHPTLSIITYNAGAGAATPEQLTHWVQTAPAEVIAWQELTPAGITALQTLSHIYPYQLFDSTVGMGVMSQRPFSGEQWLAVPNNRPILRVGLETTGGPTQLWVIHPLPPTLIWSGVEGVPVGIDDRQPEQVLWQLAAEAEKTAGAQVVVGDFNQTEWSPAYRQLTSFLVDAYVEKGWGLGWSFPHRLTFQQVELPPLLRLDMILHSAHWQTHTAAVVCPAGSDHCAVQVVLERP